MGRRKSRMIVGAAVSGVVAAAVGCSLGLDESLIDARRDGGPDVTAQPDAASGEDATAIDAGAPPTGCTKDEDCATTDACLVGKCEMARGACIYDVCRPAACQAATCTNGACTDPKPHGLQAQKFDLGTTVLSGDVVAAVHPYLFLGTALGLLVFDVSNPSTPPRKVTVTGLAFVPTSFAVSGRRLYFVGGAVGGAPSRLPLAWADVPSMPGAPSITASSVLATYARSETPKVHPRSDGEALLVGPNTSAWASTHVAAPLVEPLDLKAFPAGFAGLVVVGGTSGQRLVATNAAGFQQPRLSVVANPGEQGSTAEDTVVDAGLVQPSGSFASYADGALAWATGAVVTAGPNSVRAVQLLVPFASADAGVSTSPFVDVETYVPGAVGIGQDVVGPIAFVDPSHVMVTAAATESPSQTSVKFVDRTTMTVVPKTAAPDARRLLLPISQTAIVGAAGSNGIGYLVTNEAPSADASTTGFVYVVDSACD